MKFSKLIALMMALTCLCLLAQQISVWIELQSIKELSMLSAFDGQSSVLVERGLLADLFAFCLATDWWAMFETGALIIGLSSLVLYVLFEDSPFSSPTTGPLQVSSRIGIASSSLNSNCVVLAQAEHIHQDTTHQAPLCA